VVHTKNKTLILTNMKKNPANVAIAFLIVIQILFLAGLQSCDGLKRDGDLSNVIKFEFVDPLEKVLVEASYFPPKEAISEVVRGENATLQFVVRSQYSITGLKVNVSQAMDGETV
jgi:hypothetical protein